MCAVTSKELASHTLISKNVSRSCKCLSKDTYNTPHYDLFTFCFPSKAAERGTLHLLSLFAAICFYVREEAMNVKLKGLILFMIAKILGLKNQFNSSAFHLPR